MKGCILIDVGGAIYIRDLDAGESLLVHAVVAMAVFAVIGTGLIT